MRAIIADVEVYDGIVHVGGGHGDKAGVGMEMEVVQCACRSNCPSQQVGIMPGAGSRLL